jgi:hypothetical protein
MTVNTEVKQEQPLPQDKVEAAPPAQETNSPEAKAEQPPEDPNWRAFREARKLDRAATEAANKRAAEKEAEAEALKAAMEAAFAKSPPYQQQHQEYGQEEETEDQRIEKKVQKALEAREQQYRQEAARREQQEYPDFNNMIAQENLDYLDYHYPEVSRPLQRLQDGFDKWSDIYHAIKKFVPNHANIKKDSMKADSNMLKPKSMSSMPNSPPTGKAQESWKETEQRRAQRYEDMKKIINSVG